jgi:hypothetical protein
MAIVAVYKFRALFPSTSEPADALPGAVESREGLLLLKQETDTRDDAAAIAACAFRGAAGAVIERYSPLDVAALQRPQNREFVELHAVALKEGNVIVSYIVAPDNAQGSPSQ